MPAGTLSTRCTFLAPMGGLRTDFNERVPVYAAYGKRWCEVSPLTGRELLLAQTASSEVTYRVRLRSWSRVKTSHRLTFGGTTLHVQSVIDVGDGEMELSCSEVQVGEA